MKGSFANIILLVLKVRWVISQQFQNYQQHQFKRQDVQDDQTRSNQENDQAVPVVIKGEEN
jgi:hypothetical protein